MVAEVHSFNSCSVSNAYFFFLSRFLEASCCQNTVLNCFCRNNPERQRHLKSPQILSILTTAKKIAGLFKNIVRTWMSFALASVQRAASSNKRNIIQAITLSPNFSLAKKSFLKIFFLPAVQCLWITYIQKLQSLSKSVLPIWAFKTCGFVQLLQEGCTNLMTPAGAFSANGTPWNLKAKLRTSG